MDVSFLNTTFVVYKHPPLFNFNLERFAQYEIDLSRVLDEEVRILPQDQEVVIRENDVALVIVTNRFAYARNVGRNGGSILDWLERTCDTRMAKAYFSPEFLQDQLVDFRGPQKGVEVVYSTEGDLRVTLTVKAEDEQGFRSSGFFDTLAKWADHSMGLDITKLRLVRVACSGFVLGGGRVKIFKDGAYLLSSLETLL